MQSTSITVLVQRRKSNGITCASGHDLDPPSAFSPLVVGTGVCGLFQDKLRDLRTIIFVPSRSNGVTRSVARGWRGAALLTLSDRTRVSKRMQIVPCIADACDVARA